MHIYKRRLADAVEYVISHNSDLKLDVIFGRIGKVIAMNKEYTNSYVSFLDILGFKELIKSKGCEEIYG